MNFNLREPNPGDRISANLIREIVRAIRALTPIPGHRMKTKSGPNGTVYDVNDEVNRRQGKEPDKGRYAIESITVNDPGETAEGEDPDPSTADITFENTYYRVGGKTFEGAETGIDGVELPAIVALKVSATGSQPPTSTVESYENIAALQEAEEDQNYYIFPLYSLDDSGSVECDFRIGPETSMGEF